MEGRIDRHKSWMAYLFIAPTMILFTIFTVIPVFMALYLSFTNYDVISRMDWVGMANYKRLLNDALYWRTFGNVIYFAVLYVPANIIISLLFALLLNRKVRGVPIFRTMYYIPTLTSAVAASTVWLWLLNPEYGLINQLLGYIGITGPAWLDQTNTAMISIVMVTLWQSVGANMVIYLAGLNGVPEHLYESAKLDGASSRQCFFYITWPGLRPTTFFVTTLTMIGALQLFDQAFVLTQGGPANTTKTVVYQIYNQGFNLVQMGYASAQAFILAVAILLFAIINMRLNKEDSMV